MATQRASKKQQELFDFVRGFIAANNYGPSYREIMRALGYKSVSTVAIHINQLIEKGYLEKTGHSARSLVVRAVPEVLQQKELESTTTLRYIRRLVTTVASEDEKSQLEAAIIIIEGHIDGK